MITTNKLDRECYLAVVGIKETMCSNGSSPSVVSPGLSDGWSWIAYLNGDELTFCSLDCTERFFEHIGLKVTSESFHSEKQRARVRVEKI